MAASPVVELYRKKRVWWRLDILPFAACHTVAHVYAWRALARGWRQELIVSMIAIPMLLTLQLLTFLGTRWSVRWKCTVAYDRCSSWKQAKWALVIPPKNGGRSGLVTLHHDATKGSEVWFAFQKQTYVATSKGWEALTSPFARMPLRDYATQCRSGIQTIEELEAARAKWGANEFIIPDPTFLELFEECEYHVRLNSRDRVRLAGTTWRRSSSSKSPAASSGPSTNIGSTAPSR